MKPFQVNDVESVACLARANELAEQRVKELPKRSTKRQRDSAIAMYCATRELWQSAKSAVYGALDAADCHLLPQTVAFIGHEPANAYYSHTAFGSRLLTQPGVTQIVTILPARYFAPVQTIEL